MDLCFCDPGLQAARARLRWFLRGAVHEYVSGRDLPANDGTSKLFPHLRFGTISARTAIHATLNTLSEGVRYHAPMCIHGWTKLCGRIFFNRFSRPFLA